MDERVGVIVIVFRTRGCPTVMPDVDIEVVFHREEILHRLFLLKKLRGSNCLLLDDEATIDCVNRCDPGGMVTTYHVVKQELSEELFHLVRCRASARYAYDSAHMQFPLVSKRRGWLFPTDEVAAVALDG
ncbi:hypothetical protein D3C71_1838490 [compost metagenome]